MKRNLKLFALFIVPLLLQTHLSRADTLDVTSTGVGINDTSPAEDLDVIGNLRVRATDVTTGPEVKINNNGLLMKRSAGDSYIEATQSDGGLRFQIAAEDALIIRDDDFDIETDGVRFTGSGKANCDPLQTSSSGYIVCGSSIALKENVRTYPAGLSTVLQIRPVTFNYIDKVHAGPEMRVGFIAEEMDLVAPELTTYYPSDDSRAGQPMGVRHSAIPALLINAIKELKSKNDALEARLAALEAR